MQAAHGAVGCRNASEIKAMAGLIQGDFDHDTFIDSCKIDAWQTANVTSMGHPFSFARTRSIGSPTAWQTANVTSMAVMFAHASAFDRDLNAWRTGGPARWHPLLVWRHACAWSIMWGRGGGSGRTRKMRHRHGGASYV